MKQIILTLFLITIQVIAFCQTHKQWLKYADESYEGKDYYGASVYYRKAMLIDSSDLRVVYKYAESLRQYNEYKLAENYYTYVFSEDKGKDFPACLYWLATMQKFNAKYIDARKNFIRFSKSHKDKKSFFYRKSQQEIKSCEFAVELMKDTVKVDIFNLGDSVNTINSEFNAFPVNDSTIYFSSLRSEKMRERSLKKDKKYIIKIYEAARTDSLWKIKNELDSAINKSGFHNANSSLSKDQQKFYFSRCDNDMKCFIYVSEFKNGLWQEAEKLDDSINYPGYTTTQPCITKIGDSEVLFYVSDRPGGMGKLDIWRTVSDNGKFVFAQNMGHVVNSIDDEISPSYDTINKTLYFSSAWPYGLGGFDIFKTIFDGQSVQAPENIGYPMNTSVNDLYFTFNPETKSGFLTSNRIGSVFMKGETCCNDLWYYKLIVPETKIKDSLPAEPLSPLEKLLRYLPVKLYFHNDEPNPKTRDTVSTMNYITSYHAYKNMIGIYRENYSNGLEGDKKVAAEDTVNVFFEHQVDKGVQDLENFTELLFQELEKGHNLDLMVKGHASSLAKTDYNVPLTQRRISSLDIFLREYKGGIFLPYLNDSAANGGSLKLIRLPFGEYKAHKYLSDNLNDKKNSVYSISAAIHRNIEIVSVTLSHRDGLSSNMRFGKEIYDFGASREGQKLTHLFKFKNTGKSPLIISSINTSCECITVKGPTIDIAAGEKGEIEVCFDTKGLKGKEVGTIILHTNATPTIRELSVTTEVK